MYYSGAQILLKLLERQGIRTISGIPGGTNLPMYDALRDSPIRHVLARHEQGAGFIAQGMARASGQPAVCFATSGPGATNLLTAIADAKLDSIPRPDRHRRLSGDRHLWPDHPDHQTQLPGAFRRRTARSGPRRIPYCDLGTSRPGRHRCPQGCTDRNDRNQHVAATGTTRNAAIPTDRGA